MKYYYTLSLVDILKVIRQVLEDLIPLISSTVLAKTCLSNEIIEKFYQVRVY